MSDQAPDELLHAAIYVALVRHGEADDQTATLLARHAVAVLRHIQASDAVKVVSSPDDLMTIPEAAAFYDVSTRTIRRRIEDGSLVAHRVGPRVIKIKRRDLEELMSVIKETL